MYTSLDVTLNMWIVDPQPIFRANRSLKRSNGSELVLRRDQRNGLELLMDDSKHDLSTHFLWQNSD